MKRITKCALAVALVFIMFLQTCTVILANDTAATEDGYKLVAQFDFEKTAEDTTGLNNKVGSGSLAANSADISNGVITVKSDSGSYLQTNDSCVTDDGDVLYDLTNKTIVMKAKIECDSSVTANDALFHRQNSANLKYLSNTEDIARDDWRVFVISFAATETEGTVTRRLYMSTTEYPTAPEDFILMGTELDVTETYITGKNRVSFGKTYNTRNTNDPTCNTSFDYIKVYEGVLNEEQLYRETRGYEVIARWDFEGAAPAEGATDERLYDSVEPTKYSMTVSGDKVSIANGIAYVPATASNYLYLPTAANAVGAELNTVNKKTFLVKAKITNPAVTLTSSTTTSASILGRRNLFDYQLSDLEGYLVKDEYRIFAAVVNDADGIDGGTVITRYMSTCELPKSAEDFVMVNQETIDGGTLANENAAGRVYFGRTHNGKDNGATVDIHYDDIIIYDGILSADQLAAEANALKPRAPIFQGTQIAVAGTGVTKEGTFGIRFVGTVENKEMAELGFKITATYTGATADRDLSQFCTVVYKQIKADTKYGIEAYDAEKDFNSKYIYTLTVVDIPLELITAGGAVEFTVTPYSREANAASDDLGVSKKVTVTYDASKVEEFDKFVTDIEEIEK